MRDSPLRIGMFTSSLPEPHRKPGGVDVLIDRVSRRLTRRGHDVRMYSYSPKPDGAAYDHVGLRPHRLADVEARPHGDRPAEAQRAGHRPASTCCISTATTGSTSAAAADGAHVLRLGADEARTATRLRRRSSQRSPSRSRSLASRLATVDLRPHARARPTATASAGRSGAASTCARGRGRAGGGADDPLRRDVVGRKRGQLLARASATRCCRAIRPPGW